MSYPRRQRSFWARIKLSVEKFAPHALNTRESFLTNLFHEACETGHRERRRSYKKSKSTGNAQFSNCCLLSFPILRSEFCRYRQNPNGTLKKLFQFEPGANPDFSPDISDLIFRFAWDQFRLTCRQREEHNSQRISEVNSFFKKNSKKITGRFLRCFWNGGEIPPSQH